VGIYIKESLVPTELPEFKMLSTADIKVENMWFKVSKNKTKYVADAIYRHPNENIDNFLASLDPVLNKISSQKFPRVIAGDINILIFASVISISLWLVICKTY